MGHCSSPALSAKVAGGEIPRHAATEHHDHFFADKDGRAEAASSVAACAGQSERLLAEDGVRRWRGGRAEPLSLAQKPVPLSGDQHRTRALATGQKHLDHLGCGVDSSIRACVLARILARLGGQQTRGPGAPCRGSPFRAPVEKHRSEASAPAPIVATARAVRVTPARGARPRQAPDCRAARAPRVDGEQGRVAAGGGEERAGDAAGGRRGPSARRLAPLPPC